MSDFSVEFSTRYSWHKKAIFLLSIAITYMSCNTHPAPLHFSTDIDRFVKTEDSTYQFYQEFVAHFNAYEENRIILLSIKTKQGVFSKTFLKKVNELTLGIAHINGVLKVYSPTSSVRLIKDGSQIKLSPLLHIDDSLKLKEDSLLICQAEEFALMHWSKSGKEIFLTVFPTPFISENKYRALLNSVKELSKWYFPKESILLSQSLLLYAYENLLSDNALWLGLIALVVTMSLLWIFYKSVSALYLPFLIIGTILIILWCLVIVQGGACDFLTLLIPVIVGMVTISNTMFFRSYYQHSTNPKSNHFSVLAKEFREIGFRVLIGNLFTASGFYCLTFSGIASLTDFGTYTSIGTLISYMLCFLLLRTEAPWNQASKMQKSVIQIRITQCIAWLNKHPRYILLIVFGGIAFILPNLKNIQINGSLLSELPKNHPAREAFIHFDTAYGGARKINIVMKCKNPKDHWLNASRLQQADSIGQMVRNNYSMREVISPMFMIKAAHKSLFGEGRNHFRLPNNDDSLSKCINLIQLSPFSEEFGRLLSNQESMLRLTGQMESVDLNTIQKLNHQFEILFSKSALSSFCNAHLTGETYLLDKVPSYLVKEMKIGLMWVMAALLIVILLFTRSIIMSVIAFIVNSIPLIGAVAVMVIAQIPFKADTAIIFPIAFGISCESTLHIMQQFSLEKLSSKSIWAAYTNAYSNLLLPITKNTLIFLLGFSTLLLSDIPNINDIGLLISISLVLSWIANMVIMHVLFYLYGNNIQR